MQSPAEHSSQSHLQFESFRSKRFNSASILRSCAIDLWFGGIAQTTQHSLDIGERLDGCHLRLRVCRDRDQREFVQVNLFQRARAIVAVSDLAFAIRQRVADAQALDRSSFQVRVCALRSWIIEQQGSVDQQPFGSSLTFAMPIGSSV